MPSHLKRFVGRSAAVLAGLAAAGVAYGWHSAGPDIRGAHSLVR